MNIHSITKYSKQRSMGNPGPMIPVLTFTYKYTFWWLRGRDKSLYEDNINTCKLLLKKNQEFLCAELAIRESLFGITMSHKIINRASLVAQWLRTHLPMQGTQVRALVWEDPTCRPRQLSPCTTTTEARAPRARAPQQEKPPQWEARAPQQRGAPTLHAATKTQCSQK